MPRTDISEHLIHFTKGSSEEDAFNNLLRIISDQCLRGSSNLIKGSYSCVCFSEAPLGALSDGLVSPKYYSRYSPFGILVSKAWLFEQGGRPVIYQTDAEFYNLPEVQRWKHVLYNPPLNPPVDFTWEREWRIQCNELAFDPSVASIVVPNQAWAQNLINQHERDQEFRIMEYSLIFDETLAQMYYESFRWNIIKLR